jgi:hypothetical protein
MAWTAQSAWRFSERKIVAQDVIHRTGSVTGTAQSQPAGRYMAGTITNVPGSRVKGCISLTNATEKIRDEHD